MRVLVSGMLAGDPGQGGATWAVLQYVLGLERLGHEVRVVEPVPAFRADVVAYFDDVVRALGLEGRAALLRDGTAETVGAPYASLEGADALLAVAGMLTDERLLERIPVRIYLDLDPVFTQLWASQGVDLRLEHYTHFATVGLSIGSADCAVPTLGRSWRRTLPPVVLDRWAVAETIRSQGFTTVGNWRSYGPVHVDGTRYGLRAHSARELAPLASRTTAALMPALAIAEGDAADRELLARHGWELVDPARAAGTPAAYHAFVQGSRAELGIAKEGYVVARCGWFSDRSACYLASGRPVVLQETGFSAHLPTGEGLLAYASLDEAAGAIEAVEADYERHRTSARDLAVDLLDSDHVLSELLAWP